MSTLAIDQAQWQPPRPGGLGLGATLALLAHAALVAGLALGVAWRSSPSSEVMSAELWSAVPEVAAPAPVEPAPSPKPRPVEPPRPDPRIEQQQRDAQIALERAEKKKKLEQEQEEKLKEDKRKKELAAKEAERKKAEEERLARQREENLARIRGLAGASGPATSTGTALREAAPSASYAGRIMARIKPNIVVTGEVPDNAVAEVEVKTSPDGRITGRRIIKSSGHAVWEEAVLRAIDRTEILPKDTDGRVPASFPIVFKRRE